MKDKIQKSSPRDVFMYFITIVSLYISTFSVIRLLFEYINALFPDPLERYNVSASSTRWALALLIILFPVYLWTSRFLYRDISSNPKKRDIKVRKWLVYFTLFVAALLIIGDLVALLFSFLEGELSIRFFLKVIAILAVAAAVFGYYFNDLKSKTGKPSSNTRKFVWAIIGVVIAIIVTGFFVVGSPLKQRLVRFDREKVRDLQIIQGQVINYWRVKGELPGSLDDLRNSISGFAPPQDPQSKARYGYDVTGNLSFDLCSDFNLDSFDGSSGVEERFILPKPVDPFGTEPGSWDHKQGAVCFKRTIDPDIYGDKENNFAFPTR